MTAPATDAAFVPLIAASWQLYEHFVDAPFSVKPSIPILYFGDYERYRQSPLKVVTVGLNPSRAEFPQHDPFTRFRAAEGIYPAILTGQHYARFLHALRDYFRTEPYTGWFNPSFEHTLNGMDASYYDGQPSTALHTDICSPLATNPTWNGLDWEDQQRLEPLGTALWHRLINVLQPDVIVISVARWRLETIRFPIVREPQVMYTVTQRLDGTHLKKPSTIIAWKVQLTAGKTTLIVFGEAANKPFGKRSTNDKLRIGEAIRAALENPSHADRNL